MVDDVVRAFSWFPDLNSKVICRRNEIINSHFLGHIPDPFFKGLLVLTHRNPQKAASVSASNQLVFDILISDIIFDIICDVNLRSEIF